MVSLSRPTAWRGVTLAAIAPLAACELTDTTAPNLEPRAVVHAVLNPASQQQVILVERTLRSLSTSEGVREPITDARVVIYGPGEDSVVAASDGATAGVYTVSSVTITDGSSVPLPPFVLRLRPGERYRLRVETPLGVVTGETTVPVSGAIDGARRTFNVDRDTLRLVGTARAGGYVLRHETSSGGRERYVATLDEPLLFPLAQAGANADDKDWAFEWAREAIRPGHAQNFVVIAVDSNYFRYYVAGFDPFGDDTRGNTLRGGVGLFGSAATMMAKTLDLVADLDTPIEGLWAGDRPTATLPLTLGLYSSPYFPGASTTGTVFISGRGIIGASRLLEATGSINGENVALDLIDVSANGFVRTTGLLAAGTLVLTDTRTGERVTYRKR